MLDRFFDYLEKPYTPEKFSTPPRTKESKLLLCKCARTRKDYFVRLDRKRGAHSWTCAYAFPFHESLRGDSCVAKKREVINIEGKADDWNGCPYCKRESTVFCNCGTIFCFDFEFEGDYATCPVCRNSYPVYKSDTFHTSTSSY